MYYREQWIDGKLMYRNTPTGQWKKFTLEMYCERLRSIVNNPNGQDN